MQNRAQSASPGAQRSTGGPQSKRGPWPTRTPGRGRRGVPHQSQVAAPRPEDLSAPIRPQPPPGAPHTPSSPERAPPGPKPSIRRVPEARLGAAGPHGLAGRASRPGPPEPGVEAQRLVTRACICGPSGRRVHQRLGAKIICEESASLRLLPSPPTAEGPELGPREVARDLPADAPHLRSLDNPPHRLSPASPAGPPRPASPLGVAAVVRTCSASYF